MYWRQKFKIDYEGIKKLIKCILEFVFKVAKTVGKVLYVVRRVLWKIHVDTQCYNVYNTTMFFYIA